MKTAFVILTLATASWCLPPDVYKAEFVKFKENFNRTYANTSEEAYRFQIFSENLDKILQHNRKYERGEESFKLGITKFTDMTYEEYLDYVEHGGHRNFGSDITPEEYKEEFFRFKEKYHKTYPTIEEEEYRFKVFSDNLHKIIQHNRLFEKGIMSYKKGINNFTDFTHEEYMKWLEEQGGGHRSIALPPQSYLQEFENFKVQFHKTYANRTEETYRFNIFSQNFEKILEHNEKYEKGIEQYKEKVTMFTDMTKKEFLKWLEEHGGGRPPWAPTTDKLVPIGY